MKLIETGLIETFSKSSVENQITKRLETLCASEDFDIDYEVAPFRTLISNPNIASLYLTAFVVEKLIKAVALNLVNRLLGMGFGFLVTAFVISMILWPINQINAEKQIIKPERTEGSILYRPLSGFAPAVFPYLKKQEWKEFIPRKKKGKENVHAVEI